MRRVRDRIDREYAQPLDVEALARGAHMSAGHLSREFRAAYGESPLSVDKLGGVYEERPELFVGAAFLGGFVVAQILKKVVQ